MSGCSLACLLCRWSYPDVSSRGPNVVRGGLRRSIERLPRGWFSLSGERFPSGPGCVIVARVEEGGRGLAPGIKRKRKPPAPLS